MSIAGSDPAALQATWRALDPALQAQARTEDRPAGTLLFRQGQRPRLMHLVLAGEAVMQRTSPGGSVATLQAARAGQLLAEASLTSTAYHCDGLCRTDCRLMLMPIAALRQAIDDHPQTRWAWIGLLSQQARQQRLRTERLALKSIRDRLRHLLLTEGDAQQGLDWPGTRLALAAELAVTHEALYRATADLVARRELEIRGQRWCWLAD